jgi:hypothetical protein
MRDGVHRALFSLPRCLEACANELLLAGVKSALCKGQGNLARQPIEKTLSIN